ncbi:MAG: hypothetical protein ACRDYB_02950 [Acidimicrobiales bacterium]
MIVLILVAVLWVAVLVPSVVLKVRERRSAGSIGRFHQRLDLLERTGPKTVEPAYRLTGTEAMATSWSPIVVSTPPPPLRPNLTLVPPVVDAVPDDDDLQNLRPLVLKEVVMEPHFVTEEPGDQRVLEEEIGEIPTISPRGMAAHDRRKLARRRRRDVFAALCGLTALTALLGLAPALRGAWVVSGIVLTALVAFVGLAVYGQRIEAERHHLAKLRAAEEAAHVGDGTESPMVKYLSEDELAQYRDAVADRYEAEDARLAAEA